MSLPIYLTPRQVEERLGKLKIPCRFTGAEERALSTTPIVGGGGRVIVFPTPAESEPLTLSVIKDCVGSDPARQPSIFEHEWYANEGFMDTPCPPGWHALHMDALPESVGQSADYVRSLASRGWTLPMAVEVVLMLFLQYVGTGEQLLQRKHSWCLDQASQGRRVTVGAFGRNGVFLSGHPENFASRGLGICPKVVRT